MKQKIISIARKQKLGVIKYLSKKYPLYKLITMYNDFLTFSSNILKILDKNGYIDTHNEKFINYGYPNGRMVNIENQINKLYDKLSRNEILSDNISSNIQNIRMKLQVLKDEKFELISIFLNNFLSYLDNDELEYIILQLDKKRVHSKFYRIFDKYGLKTNIKYFLKTFGKNGIKSMIDHNKIDFCKNNRDKFIDMMIDRGEPTFYNINGEIVKHSYISYLLYYRHILSDEIKNYLKEETDYKIVDHYGIENSSPSGLSFILLENRYGYNTLVIRGTDIRNGFNNLYKDLLADYSLLSNKIPIDQVFELCNYIDNMIKSGKITKSAKLTIAGHSLGGALTQIVSTIFKDYIYTAYTYNSPGVKKFDIKVDRIGNDFFYNGKKIDKENIKYLNMFKKHRNDMSLNGLITNIGLFKSKEKYDLVFNLGEHIGNKRIIFSTIMGDLINKKFMYLHAIKNIIEKLNSGMELKKIDNRLSEHEIISIFAHNNENIENVIRLYEYRENEISRYEINFDMFANRYNVDIEDIKRDNPDIFKYMIVLGNHNRCYIYYDCNADVKIGDKKFTLQKLNDITLVDSRYPFIHNRQYEFIEKLDYKIDELNELYLKCIETNIYGNIVDMK